MSIETEQQTLNEMIQLFCTEKHGTDGTLCDECSELLTYAHARLNSCPFGDGKPVCRQCGIHCYSPDMRLRITTVMRFAGPRMLRKNPKSAIRHLLHSLRKKLD
jgi:hypothetical protein